MAEFVLPDGTVLHNVHEEADCAGRHCTIHNSSAHHMRLWPLVWRNDKKVFERTCPHGTGHTDLDQVAFLRSTGRAYRANHACGCRCCVDTTIDGELVMREISS